MLILTKINTPVKILCFADDIAMYHSHEKANITSLMIQNSLISFLELLNKLHPELSINKCRSVIFTLRPYNIAHALIYHNNSPLQAQTTDLQIFGTNYRFKINMERAYPRDKIKVLSSS